MYPSIIEILCLDQIFIERMAKVRKVKTSKDTMPVSIVALGSIEIGERILFS
jgi:hypothetical protein